MNRIASFAWLAALSTWSLAGQTQNFPTIVEWTNGSLPHYSCGAPGEAACFTGCANSTGISLYSDPYTGKVNCDLPPSTCTLALGQFPFNSKDITFLVVTDVHLRNGHGITDLQHSFHTFFMRQMGTNGWKWNVSNAGFPADKIGFPTAVVSTGDETDDGQQTSLGAFRLLYEGGWSSDALNLPLFPGLGNHDLQADCNFDNCAQRMLDYANNTASCNINGIDSGSKNYSWDWGKYHMVQLNNWAGDTMAGINNSVYPSVTNTHPSGLPWLIEDLAAHVGNSGRPVIFFQHYGWDSFSKQLNTDGSASYWSDTDRQSFLNAIKGYNVVGIVSGHNHNVGSYAVPTTDNNGNPVMLEDFVGGVGGQNNYGQFFVVRLTDQFFDLMPVEWADPTIYPTVTSPYPVKVGTATGNSPFFNSVQGCRKWLGPALHRAPLTVDLNGLSIKITNNTTSTIPGPFALEYDTLSGSIPAAPGQIMFTANCAAGPLYVMGQKTQLAPGESETISLNSSMTNTDSPTAVVSTGGDYFQATPNPVTVPTTGSTTVHLTSAYGANVPFVALDNDTTWLKVVADSTQTPATLTLSIDPTKVGTNQQTEISVGTTNPAYAGIKFPVTIATVPVTFTSPDNETITADNQTVQTPVTFNWLLNSTHTVSAQTQNPQPGVQDRFLGWSTPGSSFTFQVTAPATYAVKFQQYVTLAVTPSPTAGGTITFNPPSPDGYFASGTPVTITAAPSSGYTFSSFENQPLGANPVTITPASAAIQMGAKFLPAGGYLISTSLGAAGTVTIDGAMLTGPQTVTWVNNTSHFVTVPALVFPSAGIQYVFQQWSDGVATASRGITAGSISSFTAQYQQQFLVTVNASPAAGGTISGGGWYNANANASLTASAASGFNFTEFSGSAVSSQSAFSFAVTSPDTVIGNFAPGTPVLRASAGTHTNNAQSTQLNIVVANTGAGAAASTSLNITATVQSGTGTVTAIGVTLPQTISPGQTVSLPVVFLWPPTAIRVAFTVGINANDGSYTASSTFYVVR
jgi:hypothetical protein